MRVHTKPGKPTKLILDNGEQRKLTGAISVLRAVEKHGEGAESECAQAAAANIQEVLNQLSQPVNAEGEPVTA